jgi:hypothetical protein
MPSRDFLLNMGKASIIAGIVLLLLAELKRRMT